MTPNIYKIEVSIRVTWRDGYDTKDLATAKVEDQAPWDEIKPTAVHRHLDAVLEDATARVERQIKAEHLRRREEERQAELSELA